MGMYICDICDNWMDSDEGCYPYECNTLVCPDCHYNDEYIDWLIECVEKLETKIRRLKSCQ